MSDLRFAMYSNIPFMCLLCLILRDGDFLRQVHILNGVQQRDTFLHWPLKCFPAGDEPCSARAFIDDGGFDGFLKIAFTGGGTAGVDQSSAAHVTVRDLVAGEVDGVV